MRCERRASSFKQHECDRERAGSRSRKPGRHPSFQGLLFLLAFAVLSLKRNRPEIFANRPSPPPPPQRRQEQRTRNATQTANEEAGFCQNQTHSSRIPLPLFILAVNFKLTAPPPATPNDGPGTTTAPPSSRRTGSAGLSAAAHASRRRAVEPIRDRCRGSYCKFLEPSSEGIIGTHMCHVNRCRRPLPLLIVICISGICLCLVASFVYGIDRTCALRSEVLIVR